MMGTTAVSKKAEKVMTPKEREKLLQGHLANIDTYKLGIVCNAVKIGGELLAIKEILQRGEFPAWLEQHCTFSLATAYNYMGSFQIFGKCDRIENFDDSALYVLAKCPEAAETAKAMAKKGQRISYNMAKELVEQVRNAVDPDESVDAVPTSPATAEVETTSDSNMDQDHVLDVEPRACPNCGGKDFDADGDCSSCYEPPADEPAAAPQPPAPFAAMPEFPPRVSDAFDVLKLAIIQSRQAGWTDTSPEAIGVGCDKMKAFALGE